MSHEGRGPELVPVEQMSHGVSPRAYGPPGIEDSLVGATQTAIELRRIRSLLLGMTIEECVNVCRADAWLGAVVTTLLTPEKARKVTTQLLPEERKKIIAESLRWNPETVAADAAQIMEKIQAYKYERLGAENLAERLRVYLDQVGPDGEEKVFEELLAAGRHSDFAWLVRDALPTSLLEYVPDSLLQSVLTHMSYRDQVELLAFAPKNISERVWNLLPGSSKKAKSLIESDVEKKQKEIQFGDPVPHEALGLLMTVVRQALRTDSIWYEHVKPYVEQYIFQRTKGLEGSSDGRAA
jgi:Mg/Co/Ni transporter MgtE